eukprot:scaffold2306_cov95-Isochrysis_galbana.AAC.2
MWRRRDTVAWLLAADSPFLAKKVRPLKHCRAGPSDGEAMPEAQGVGNDWRRAGKGTGAGAAGKGAAEERRRTRRARTGHRACCALRSRSIRDCAATAPSTSSPSTSEIAPCPTVGLPTRAAPTSAS